MVSKIAIISIFSIIFLIQIQSQKISNCQVYKISRNICSECSYGYQIQQIDNGANKCVPKIWIRLTGLIMSLKYLSPIFQFNSVFIDFVGEYWFFVVKTTDEVRAKKMMQSIVALNNQRLWPIDIQDFLKIIFGPEITQQLYTFFTNNLQTSPKQLTSIKKYLYLSDSFSFSFTTMCITRLLMSFIICFCIYILVRLIEKIIFWFTNYKILEKRLINGTFILMLTSHLYQFIGFYGFYHLKNFEGFKTIGMKINLILTVFSIFAFTFVSICLLPLIYYFNLNESGGKKIKSKTNLQRDSREIAKIHRIMKFSYTPAGYFYFLIDGPFKQFIIGVFAEYFKNQSAQYVILALIYFIQLILLQTLAAKYLEAKLYFILRRGFVIVTILYLLLLYEQIVHIFSKSTDTFEEVREISLCLLFSIGFIEFLLKFIHLTAKIYKKLMIWTQKGNKITNFEQLNKSRIIVRKHLRQPSIAEKLLKRLKSMKSSQIIACLPQNVIIIDT